MSHECGYTEFDVRLDNATNVRFGDAANVLSIRADASFGSGHWSGDALFVILCEQTLDTALHWLNRKARVWRRYLSQCARYEGGGLYRLVQLVHTQSTHIVTDGLYVPPGPPKNVEVSAELETTAAGGANASVQFSLLSSNGTAIASVTSNIVLVPGSANNSRTSTAVASATFALSDGAVTLWTIKNPVVFVSCTHPCRQHGAVHLSVRLLADWRSLLVGTLSARMWLWRALWSTL